MIRRDPTTTLFVVTFAFALMLCVTLLLRGMSPSTFAILAGEIAFALLLAWWLPRVPTWHLILDSSPALLDRALDVPWIVFGWLAERWRAYESKRLQRLQAQRDRLSEEKERERILAEERQAKQWKREEEVRLALQPCGKGWQSRHGIDTTFAETYGTGIEFVYCYAYSRDFKQAKDRCESRFVIKVGFTRNDPIQRICEQLDASKTAISDSVIVLLVLQIDQGRDLERWLHRKLPRVQEALGREWFITSETEILDLFRSYLKSNPPGATGGLSASASSPPACTS